MPQLAQGAAWFGQLAMVEPHVHGSTFMMLRILVWLTSAAAFKAPVESTWVSLFSSH